MTPNTKRNQQVEIPTKTFRFLRRFFRKLGIKIAKNSKYNLGAILTCLLYAATNKYSPEAAVAMLKVQLPTATIPSADTLLRRIKEIPTKKIFSVLQKIIRQTVHQSKHLFKKRVKVAIDIHDIPYYGNHKTDIYVVGTKRKNGTNYAHSYITAEVVDGDKRFCIVCLQMKHGDDKAEFLAKVLSLVKRVIMVECILLDRGFYTINCISELKKAKVNFITPVIKDKRMKKVMHEHRVVLPEVTKYTLGNEKKGETFTLCLKRVEHEVYGFATNIVFDGFTKQDKKKFLEEISDTYSARWGIETGYRVKKDFRIKTTSRNIVVRKFFFFLSVLLYNAWVEVNIFSDTHITTVLFNKLLEFRVVSILGET